VILCSYFFLLTTYSHICTYYIKEVGTCKYIDDITTIAAAGGVRYIAYSVEVVPPIDTVHSSY
jgi:hypothetical protein